MAKGDEEGDDKGKNDERNKMILVGVNKRTRDKENHKRISID